MHAIDLSAKGYIRPHVDSIKFSGSIVAGLSLLSSATMVLRHTESDAAVTLFLPPRSVIAVNDVWLALVCIALQLYASCQLIDLQLFTSALELWHTLYEDDKLMATLMYLCNVCPACCCVAAVLADHSMYCKEKLAMHTRTR